MRTIIIFKGLIDHKLIEKEKDNSEFFVIKPSFTESCLPKRLKKQIKESQKMNENGQLDSMKELDTKKIHEKDKEENENLVENLKNAPDSNLYFPVGFNKNDNPLKLKEKNKTEHSLGEININDEEKEGLIRSIIEEYIEKN